MPEHDGQSAGTTRTLDVSNLEPPEPMTRILAEITALRPGERLEVTHHREPIPLYAHLEEAGFDHKIERLGPSLYRLTIWKKS